MMTIRDLLSSHWSIYHQRSLLSVKIHWLSHDSFFFFFFVFFLLLLLHFLLKPFTLNKSTCLVAHTQFCSRSMFRYQFGWRHLVIILTWLASVCVGFVYVGLYGGSQFRWSNLGFFFFFSSLDCCCCLRHFVHTFCRTRVCVFCLQENSFQTTLITLQLLHLSTTT